MNEDKLSFLLENGMPLSQIQRMMGDGLSLDSIAESAKRVLDLGESISEEAEATPTLSAITAADLQRKNIPPIRWIVKDLIPAGLSILASPPKYGKSWAMLDLGLSVTAGKCFLGYATVFCDVLYLALEDSERRLKSRMSKLLAGKPAPAEFFFSVSAHDMDNGLFDELENFLHNHSHTGMIIIDTLQKVRGSAHGKAGGYADDYREIGALKTFADKHNIAVLLVHHLRKMRDDGDPFNMISGTNGIMGAADTTMVLTREKRGDDTTTLSIVGRDVESTDAILRFNKVNCRWENLGDADAFAEQQARVEYADSPIVRTIKKLLEQSPDGWIGTAQQILDAGKFIARTHLADSPRALTAKLKSMANLLLDYDGIAYEQKRNGSGGGKHHFYYTDSQFEELEQTEIDPFSGG